MELSHLLDTVQNYKEFFGVKDDKFKGALSVELMRLVLEENGIITSGRDVFIKGVPLEVDLLIPSTNAKPEYGFVYRPEDVIAALEVKARGCYGKEALNSIREAFDLIRKSNAHIGCAYVTLTELKGYKWAVDKKKLGYDAFTLAWHTRQHEKPGKWPSTDDDWQELLTPGEWERFLNWLRDQIKH
ncbi:MAG: hypothetical protein ABSH01_14230 [Terriglobia bacterium]|jgi:hypothetical protein